MKKKLPLALILAAVLVLAIVRFGFDRDDGSVDLVLPSPRTLDARDVVTYTQKDAHTFRVRTTRDVLPGGLSAAMAPVLVDWGASDLSPGGSILFRNLNDGGNPVSGVTVLRTARVRPDRLSKVEFMLIPLGGPKAISHGQLRFVFDEGGIEIVGSMPEGEVGEPDSINDLVFSWEAWRPPGVDFDVLVGMDSDAYQLSLRTYSGRQRFMEDALAGREWEVYTLSLPGGKAGARELLLVCFALGDGAARYTIGQMLDEAEEEWVLQGPGSETGGEDATSQWRALREKARSQGVPTEDPLLDMTGKTGYQSLIRSCASMALYSVDVAVTRLIDSGTPHDGMRPTQTPWIGDEPEWMADLAHTNLAGIFVRSPKAVRFLLANPSVVPSEIPGALDKAGLLVQEDGEPLVHHYTINGQTPWGHRNQLLIK